MEKDEPQKFEGPEKKLEIWFDNPRLDMRHLEDQVLKKVVAAVGARIIRGIENEHMKAYLLAESSLFVWRKRLVLITCGKTRLVNVFPELFNGVRRSDVAAVFYERKSSLYPKEQRWNFVSDVSHLETFFSGESFRIGPLNGDHVHLYFASGQTRQSSENELAAFEILMKDLDIEKCRIFSFDTAKTASEIEKLSGIDTLFPEMKRDSHLFLPHGFSLNAIEKDTYITIHVTPQPIGSYASFETNAPIEDHGPLISKVLSIFKPGRFSLLAAAAWDKRPERPFKGMEKATERYAVTDVDHGKFRNGYSITCMNLAAMK